MTPPSHHCTDAVPVGPGITTVDSVGVVDLCVDPPIDKQPSLHTTPQALPPEWLDVFHALEAIPRRHGHRIMSTTPPIISGCVSFSECIDQSREYAIKVDIDAIESTARTLLADHKGVDEDIMSRHISMIKDKGLGQALQHFSGQTLSTTLHPRPLLITNPPQRHPTLPVHPHPALRVRLSAEQQSCLTDHQARIPPPTVTDPPPPIEVTPKTQRTLGSFTLAMSFEERLHALAMEGGPLLVADDFIPNNGVSVSSYPKDVAPPGAIEIHMAANQRKGRVIVLPLEFARESCAAAGIPFHVSSCMVGQKLDADPPIGRLISDYSHPPDASLMFAGKKGLNKAHFTPIRNPTAADICQMHANAVAAFPGVPIVAARLDISSAYNRLRVRPRDIPLGALLFHGSDGVEYVAMPIVEWFGSQDSNFHFQMVTEDLMSLAAQRSVRDTQALLAGMYTDDYFVFGSLEFVEQAMKDFTADAESRLGVPAVKAEKTLCGNDIDIIGYTNDTSSNHTIGLSRPLFLKMVCAVYVMVAMDIRPGDQILVHTLQSLASRAIRSADVVPVMVPFSRGFSSCLKGVSVTATTTVLSERAYEDLWMWRVALQLGYHDRSWLVLPIRIPLLMRYLHNEDAIGRMHRQAASADVVVYVDACTQHGNGMGFYIPGMGWNSFNAPELLQFVSYDGNVAEADINLLEFVAAMIALCAVIVSRLQLRKGGEHAHEHIHIWTDNTSCLSWMMTHRAHHPIHLYLLQVLAFIKVTFNVTVTAGHVPGVVNVYADAASRHFHLDNGQGSRLRREMNLLPRLPWPDVLMKNISAVAMRRCSTTSTRTRDALTALDGVRGWSMQQQMTSHPR